ncbi:MAG TPA: hypothetical protein VN256_05460 [Pyrinomonadaceae bacterium]|nr:hypothetical protein [Pyrinomonadaceae bacterium]
MKDTESGGGESKGVGETVGDEAGAWGNDTIDAIVGDTGSSDDSSDDGDSDGDDK